MHKEKAMATITPEKESEQLFTPEEVAQLLGTTARMVLLPPIRQTKIGSQIWYKLRDVYDYLGTDNNPNLE